MPDVTPYYDVMQDRQGNAIPGATVTPDPRAGGVIYADEDATTPITSVVTGPDGSVSWWWTADTYDILVQHTAFNDGIEYLAKTVTTAAGGSGVEPLDWVDVTSLLHADIDFQYNDGVFMAVRDGFVYFKGSLRFDASFSTLDIIANLPTQFEPQPSGDSRQWSFQLAAEGSTANDGWTATMMVWRVGGQLRLRWLGTLRNPPESSVFAIPVNAVVLLDGMTYAL